MMQSAFRGSGIQFIVEPKADANYTHVGAASIVAKVTRDSYFPHEEKTGCGYPGDPKTIEYLNSIYEPCLLVR